MASLRSVQISKPLSKLLNQFASKALNNELNDPVGLAVATEALAEAAWLEAFDFTPPSIRID